MVLPGVLAVFVPVIIGFLLGPKGMCGLLGGALGGCFMLALTMATSGGAWDNAKKWNEKCAEDGEPVESKSSGGKLMPTTAGGHNGEPRCIMCLGFYQLDEHPSLVLSIYHVLISPYHAAAVTFTNFGIKKARNFPEIYREHGIEALVRDPALIPSYNTPEGLQRLQQELADLYHHRHAGTVIGDTVRSAA